MKFKIISPESINIYIEIGSCSVSLYGHTIIGTTIRGLYEIAKMYISNITSGFIHREYW